MHLNEQPNMHLLPLTQTLLNWPALVFVYAQKY